MAKTTAVGWRDGRARILESMAISEHFSDLPGIGECHTFLGMLDERDGKVDSAIVRYREAVGSLKQVGAIAQDALNDLARIQRQARQ